MKCFKSKLLLMFFVLLMAGCSQFVIPDVDLASENYPTKFKIDKTDVYSKKLNWNIEQTEFMVLVFQSYQNHSLRSKTENFMHLSLKKMGFKKVITEKEFLRMVKENELYANEIDSLGKKTLQRVNEKLGPYLFMVAEFDIGGQGRVKVKIYDPESNDEVFKLSAQAFVFSYTDQVLYPLVNAINDWYKLSLSKK